MQANIAVVTAITSKKDTLIECKKEDGVEFVAFTEQQSATWLCKPACDKFESPRNNARIHKILIHQYVDAEYSIWMDGNISMNVPAKQVVEEWLKDYDIALFKHQARNCLYDEVNTAIHLDRVRNKENEIDLINEQVTHYRNNNYPANNGLCEAGVLVRRHNIHTEVFNNYWWSEWCRYSSRDQLSFMYTANKLKMPLNVIQGTLPKTFEQRWCHPYFSYHAHNFPRGDKP